MSMYKYIDRKNIYRRMNFIDYKRRGMFRFVFFPVVGSELNIAPLNAGLNTQIHFVGLHVEIKDYYRCHRTDFTTRWILAAPPTFFKKGNNFFFSKRIH